MEEVSRGISRIFRFLLISLMSVVVVPLGGCSQTPVTYIQVFKTTPGIPAGVPPGTWAEGVGVRPHPTQVQAVFRPIDRIYLGIKMSHRLSGNVTFSKYTFFNTGTRQERQVEGARELGPYEAGQVFLVGTPWAWPVPQQPGTYQVRVYLGTRIVASAVFEVTEGP